MVPLLSSCQYMSFFIIENNSSNSIEITYSDWPERYIPEPRIGFLSDVRKSDYNLQSLPLANFQYGVNKCEIIVMVPPQSAVCIAGMQDINIVYANKYFSGAKLHIKTANGSIKYEGSEIIKLFNEVSNFQFVYSYK